MANAFATGLGAVSAASTNEAFTNFALFNIVDKWISKVDTPKGYAAHIIAGLQQQGLSVLQAPLANSTGLIGNLSTKITDAVGGGPEVARYMNQIWELFQQPNIEGIVIFTENESTSRQMDVSTSPLVVQRTSVLGAITQTSYVTDNAVPRPRTWQLTGHLTTVLSTDHYYVVKPSLLLQRDYLDMCMRTRKPVVFKSYDNNFHKVLISDMRTNWDPKSMNTLVINISLVEYVPIEVGNEIPNSARAELQRIGVLQ